MIISEQWLRDWVSVDLDAHEIAESLTSAGLEVESVAALCGVVDNLVVGRVLEVSKHPDADRLNLTKVDIGTEQLDIVCGASNVRPGLLVVVATIGAKLPNGLKIKRAEVRGVDSYGMLCSASELGLEEHSDGILELSEDAEVGQRADEYLQLDDRLIDIDLTPNRGDCLSVQGIARELKVLVDGDYHPLEVKPIAASIDDQIDIELRDGIACPRYLGRIIKGISNAVRTPMWMQERLRRCGIRPVNPVVDITNYVMLELGQPMHAFDLAKVNETIIIRQSVAGESIKLLDDSTAKLDDDTLVIADSVGTIAVAGVMGGADSAISETTRDIVLEAAHFTRKAIAGRARRYALHTESSYRFERGVDPQLSVAAMHRATELVLQICGGQAGPVNQQSAPEHIKAHPGVAIRLTRLQQLLGMPLQQRDVGDILNRIADKVVETNEGWLVVPPSYRFDIECEADLVEEVARVTGYDNIPTTMPRIAPCATVASEAVVSLRQVRQTLVARDFNEVITYSFIDPLEQQLYSQEQPVALNNPLAENLSVMRTSLLPGLLQALRFNAHRQHDRIRLFEIGATYHKKGVGGQAGIGEFTEVQRLAGLLTGPDQTSHWSITEPRNVDFFDIKADVEAILALTGIKKPFIFNGFEHIAMHPGQISIISRSGIKSDEADIVDVGFVGRLHPRLQKKYGLPAPLYAFEIDLHKAMVAQLPSCNRVSKFPSISRHLSVVVEGDLAAADLLNAVNNELGKALIKSTVFDVYQGQGVGDGRKSVSLGLVLQHQNKTMTDEDAEGLMKKALSVLEHEFAAKLRT